MTRDGNDVRKNFLMSRRAFINNRGSGAWVDATRERAGIFVLEASGVGLASRRARGAVQQAPIASREDASIESTESSGYDGGLRFDR